MNKIHLLDAFLSFAKSFIREQIELYNSQLEEHIVEENLVDDETKAPLTEADVRTLVNEILEEEGYLTSSDLEPENVVMRTELLDTYVTYEELDSASISIDL
tara:strand:+ start:302 stop:607 length:306 start_codon:yes stop_codon:yes gene_type:complete